MNWLSAGYWFLAFALALPLAVLSIELIAGLMPARRKEVIRTEARITVLIPAHNEEMGITATIDALLAVAPYATRVLVVADNCDDETASKARLAGAEVTVRDEPAVRGKGHALAFGRDYLLSNGPPEIVVVLDADCRLKPGSLESLAGEATSRMSPVQAVNLIEPDLSARPMVQISSFAVMVKNLIRSRGMQRMGGAALLTGTGMAFPWAIFACAPLASSSIVEDLRLGLAMTRTGRAPVLLADAEVRSAAADMRDALQQRTRWEHGFLDTVRRDALPTLLGGISRVSWAEVLFGLHLLVPPLALLMMLSITTAAVLASVALFSDLAGGPALFLGAMVLCATCLIIVAWLAFGRAYLSAGALLRAPLYLMWKLPIYLGFLKGGTSTWTRTPRR